MMVVRHLVSCDRCAATQPAPIDDDGDAVLPRGWVQAIAPGDGEAQHFFPAHEVHLVTVDRTPEAVARIIAAAVAGAPKPPKPKES
jgi:hypothetical protein